MMNQNEMMQAFIDDKPINVTPNTTARDLMRAQGIAENRALVQMSNNGKPIALKPNDLVNPNQGDIFRSMVEPESGMTEV